MTDRTYRPAGRRHWTATFVVIVLMSLGAFAASAQAATYTVGTTSDTTPGSPCTPSSGTCSLRQLIEFENALSATPNPPDTIMMPAGSYSLTNGVLSVTRSLSISGGGPRTTILSGNSTEQIFYVQPPASAKPPNVSISGLYITGGNADNTNCWGGDIRDDQSTLMLSQDVITGGQACSGGGIGDIGGSVTVTHSLVTGNAANSGGADSGGIQTYGDPNIGTATLEVDNSTISGNTSQLGGGIFSWCGGSGGACSAGAATNSISVVNSTIAYNDGGSRSATGGGLLVGTMTSGAPEGAISVQGSIVAFNTVSSGATQTNCGSSGISSGGFNIDSGADCRLASTGDLSNTNPQFTSNSPQNNGGHTDTLGVVLASAAVDHIPAATAGCSGTDQRDVARPQGAGCDVGAYEFAQPTEEATFSGALVSASCSPIAPTITWGDGTTSPGTVTGGSIGGTHTYGEEGSYTGSVTWETDCAPNSHNVPFHIKVADAGVAASASSFAANAGQPVSGQVASFTDADPNGTASDYTATISWGDGTTSPGTVTGTGPFTVSGSHTYAAGGFYPVGVSISDVGGSTAAATGTATVAPETQPTLTPGVPLVTSTTSAAFSTSVNPEGLATQVTFQYGPALAAARDLPQLRAQAAGPITYTASTPAQTVGPDYSNHTVTATVTGLLPNMTYHVRAVATNGAGTAVGPDQTLTTPADPAPPAPVLGESVDVAPVSGVVYIKLPNGLPLYASDRATGAASALTKGAGFLPLTEARQLPTGTQIDARLGTIQLVAATPTRHKTESGDFTGGLFGFAQDRRGVSKGLTTLSLLEGAFPGAPGYASCKAKPAADASSPIAYAAALSSKVLQTLHASAHGRFRTRGRYAAATVRGTAWTTSDRCNGTLVSVQRHTVAVTDFVRHITLLVHQGHSYLARAPRARRS